AGDELQVGGGEVEYLGVVPPFPYAHVDDDLVQPRHLPRIAVAALLHERRRRVRQEVLLEPRLGLPRALGPRLGDRRRIRRRPPAATLLRLLRPRGRLPPRRGLRCGRALAWLGHVCLTLVHRLAA